MEKNQKTRVAVEQEAEMSRIVAGEVIGKKLFTRVRIHGRAAKRRVKGLVKVSTIVKRQPIRRQILQI